MNIFNKVSLTVLVIALSSHLISCGGGGTDQPAPVVSPPVNSSPVVDAGADKNVTAGDPVTLSATATDDNPITYSWTQTAGTAVTLSGSTTATISFVAPTVQQSELLRFVVSVSDGVNPAVSDSVEVTVAAQTSTPELSHWIINTTTIAPFIRASSVVLEDVQSAELVTLTENNTQVNYVYVQASGIPGYEVIMTQDLLSELNSRPKASTDFIGGVSSAALGEQISFGENIGYNSSNTNCPTTGGDGYWPPGPVCPTLQSVKAYFAATPVPAEGTDCETGLGTIGLMVNGTAIFNWGDGASYANGVWYTLAPIAEQYDVDICSGHAAQGEYHHHFYTSCLAALVGDTGNSHSPIYGFAADGYPLYGPYESANQLALSGWSVRDYAAPVTEGGCNAAGKRSCILVDQYDLSRGVTQVQSGPDIGATVETLSRNTLTASAGYYYEDYYYSHATVSGAQLDQHNGHDTGDGKGYHYHITMKQGSAGKLEPVFPYTIGPRFKGKLAANSVGQCSTGLPPARP